MTIVTPFNYAGASYVPDISVHGRSGQMGGWTEAL